MSIKKLLSDTALHTIHHFKKEVDKLRQQNTQLKARNRELQEFNDLLQSNLNKLDRVEWPSEERIDAIGPNGNTGEHYEEMDKNER